MSVVTARYESRSLRAQAALKDANSTKWYERRGSRYRVDSGCLHSTMIVRLPEFLSIWVLANEWRLVPLGRHAIRAKRNEPEPIESGHIMTRSRALHRIQSNRFIVG
jgi:hypothetical protein